MDCTKKSQVKELSIFETKGTLSKARRVILKKKSLCFVQNFSKTHKYTID